ncbi:MAG: DUF108 domain-containing protein [Prevotella sp.]|nr:DUF108 domain-containing protein [Prevotella sp.]
MKKLVIAGCGKLGTIVADAVLDGILPGYELVGVFSRTADKAEAIAAKAGEKGIGCRVTEDFKSLMALKPDIMVEAASPAAMREWACEALRNGVSIVTLSIGAFADDDFYAEVTRTAADNNAHVYIASGATGGFDVLQTAALMGGAKAEFFNEKGPDALKGTAVYDDTLQKEQRTVFSGTAAEAIKMFPTKVNVTVAAARASVGPENMKVTMRSTPGFKGDTQRVEIRNEQVHAVIDVYSATAEIAAWSVVNTLRNITSPIVFC